MNERWEAVIGLEVHVQLSTRTKMFCGCELSFGDPPNTHTCPVCLAHPGSLPVPNEAAISSAIKIGLALGCEIAPRSIFHRKNYFYPDSPKAYQISQYDIPICGAGRLADVRIHRAHLEEDAAKLIHVSDSGRIHGSGESLVDFNRGGTPLVEIVTEPDLHDPAKAREWLTLLRTTIRQLGVSDVNMEEGSLRCDANVSLRPAGSSELGVKTELKNMNSFRFLERGVAAEIERQAAILDSGGEVVQETLHFDPRSGSLTSLRSKEEAHDYRYFPEPDLVAIAPSAESVERLRAELGELPAERRRRYTDELGLATDTAQQIAFDLELARFFEAGLAAAGGAAGVGDSPGSASARGIASWLTGELVPRLREAGADDPSDSRVTPEALAELVAMVEARLISTGAGRQVVELLAAEGGSSAQIVEREGLGQIDDSGALTEAVRSAIEANPEAAASLREGRGQAIGPIIGAVMKATQGRADGGEITRIVRAELGL